MTSFKLLSVVVSLGSLILLTLLVSGGIGVLDRGPLASIKASLDAGAGTVAVAVNAGGGDLVGIAKELAGDRDVGLALDKFVRAVNSVRPNSDPTTPQQNRIDRATEKLDEYREDFREIHTSISGVALVNDVGVVMNTDTALLAPLSNVALRTLEPILDDEGEGMTFIDAVLAGNGARTLTVSDGAIYYVGAAPISHPIRKRIIGAVLTVRKLLNLPATPGVDAMLVVEGKVTIGEAPEGFAEPEEVTKEVFLMVPTDPSAQIGGLEIMYPGFLGSDADQPGIWARRYALAGTDAAWGYVFSDLTPAYARLRGAQLLTLLLALIVWVVHLLLVVLDGHRLRSGVVTLADFLGKIHVGESEDRAIDERTLPSELRRLAKLVNQTLEHFVGGGDVRSLSSAPTVDDVLEAQDVDNAGADNMGDLAFEGISNSGTLDVAELEGGTRPPPPPLDIGEDDDGYDDSVAEAGSDLFSDEGEPIDGADTEIPDADDAAEALDHLGDGPPDLPDADADADVLEEAEPLEDGELADDAKGADSVAAAVEELAELEADGETDPDAEAPAFKPLPNVPIGGQTDATAVMKVTPELLEQMKATAEAEAKAEAAKKKAAAAKKAANKPPPKLPPKPSEDDVNDGATAVMKVTPELLKQMAEAGGTAKPAAANEVSKEPSEADHFREVFDSFVKTRKECGESGELSFEKFAKRLEQSKAAVIKKHNCAGVRFQVYVKNGKAALKATPTK